MINWPQYLLSKPTPALGWKKLARRSTGAAEFLSAHPDLLVTKEAAQQGELGWYVPNFADQAGRIYCTPDLTTPQLALPSASSRLTDVSLAP